VRTLFDEIVELQQAGKSAALATVISRTGSVPMSKWAKMLVRRDGSMSGTVGGGCLEAEIWEDARAALASGEARVVEHTLTPQHAGEFGLLCGGSVRILVERIDPEVHLEVFTAARDTVAARKRAHLITLLPSEGEGTKRLLLMPDESTVGSLGDDGLDKIAIAAVGESTGQIPQLVSIQPPGGTACSSSRVGSGGHDTRVASYPCHSQVLIEPLGPVPEIYVFGGGHVGLGTSRIGAIAGFRIIVVDDRPMFCNPERFPEADECVMAEFEGVFEQLDIGEDSYLVAVTRGHAHDETVAEQALRTDAGYIGMIGSRYKVRRILKALADRGATEEQLARIHAPIGLDIGADTPEEIAVAIVAEIIGIMRRGQAGEIRSMRERAS
jgi:xanthine dehydrogenase accessory factor